MGDNSALPTVDDNKALPRYVVETSSSRHAVNDKNQALTIALRMARNAHTRAIITDIWRGRVVFTEEP